MSNLHFEIVESMRDEHKKTVDALGVALRDLAQHSAELHEALVRKNMALRVLAEESRSYMEFSKSAPFERAIDAAIAECADMPPKQRTLLDARP